MFNANWLKQNIIDMMSNPLIHLFLITMLLDLLINLVIKSWNDPIDINNNIDIEQLFLSNLSIVITVIILYPYIIYFDYKIYGDATLIFYITKYGISIVDNFTRLGINVPPFVKNIINKIKGDKDR